ncbi:glycoprotein integral membrane protein 1 [Triplophysa dalaica]|uniref:glycoprotein integral membrane protein 1 n=1 Tax=Triplophysa dalaica TaxID=1582913 RepID=UPI0024DF36BD|nr:glycoprotein integral membrane protein 1 [Triplophysa dalaica]
MASTWKTYLMLLNLIVLCILTNTHSRQITTETVVLNVTAVNVIQTKYNVQMNLTVGLLDNETFINGAPIKHSQVTRMICPVLLLDGYNVSSGSAGGMVSSELRLMLNRSNVQNDVGDQVQLLLLSQQIIQLEDQKVHQPDIFEVEIQWNQTSEEITQVISVYPSSQSKISGILSENDILVTDTSIHDEGEDQVLNSTSHYLYKNAETTQEEIAAPGKLPETPLRMDPETLYESRGEEERNSDYILPKVPLRDHMTSYSVVCQWIEELRDKLRRFWSDSVPLFFLIMWVVVVGVAGSAVIIRILDFLFPSCEHRGFFHLNPETLMPDDEKQSLIDNVEIDGKTTEKQVLIEK